MFDYKGYNEAKLISLCSEANVKKGKANWQYWTSEVYSFGRHFRNYGFYPDFFPLYVYSDHGIGNPNVYEHETQNDAEHMFVTFDEKAKNYKEASQKPCSVIMAPFIWYRRHKKITQLQTAKGTLAFPAHSTPEIESEFDVEEYIVQLKALPDNMQPICVCLHMHDIHKGQHKIFMENDIPVYTAGQAFDVRFAERYYDILQNFKYTTSNLIGSYAYYSTEMDIPFSLCGVKNRYINISDKNLPKGEHHYENSNYLASAELFKGINQKVTEEQKEYAENLLGVHSTITRSEFAKILYLAYFKRGNLYKDLKNIIFGKMKMKIKQKIKRFKETMGLKTRLRKLKVSFAEIENLQNAGYGEATTKLFGKQIKVNSAFWYLHGLEELFLEETYKFSSFVDNPRIIDCGANTGLSVIYFKRLFPKASIIAFEPDKDIFEIIKSNLNEFGYNDVELVNKAVWKNNDGIKFLASGGVGGRITEDNNEPTIELPTTRLADLLDCNTDFLKIDIEGAEFEVINDCKDKLRNVKNLFIEYHSLEKNEQKLDEILKIIKDAGFKYYIKEAWNNQPNPYTNKRINLFDLQLNIFAYRLEK